MTAKQYLCRYQEINREIDALVEDCARLRSLAERVGCGQLSDTPRGGSTDPFAKFTHAVELIIAKEAEIDQMIDAMMTVRGEIEAKIDTVSDATLRTLLRYRYICGWTWERIAVEMDYSYMHICRLHGKVLAEIKL